MPNEVLIAEIENLLSQVVALGGQNEQTAIVPNLTVIDSAPTGLTGYIIIQDNRDGDNILARTVPDVVYTNNDLVNVLFVEGTEPIAFQQGSGSSSGGIWEIVPATSTDIFYNKGDVGVGKSVAPDAALEILDAGQAQLRLTHTEDTDFADFQIDTNANLVITPSGTGQVSVRSTTNSTITFRVQNSVGTSIFNVGTSNQAASILTEDPTFTLQGSSITSNLFVNRGTTGGRRTATFSAVGSTQAENVFLKARGGPGAVASGDVVGNFFYNGHDGTDYNRSARLYVEVDGSVSANTVPMRMAFQTSATNSGGLADRMRILSNGDIKIGTGTPAAQLDVEQDSTSAAQPVLLLDQSDVDEPFTKYIGTAAAATLTRSIVDEGDVTTATRIGWIMIEIQDDGNQVTDGDYFVPFYTLA